MGVHEIIELYEVACLDSANATGGTLLQEVISGECTVTFEWFLTATLRTSRFLQIGGGVAPLQIQVGAENSIRYYWMPLVTHAAFSKPPLEFLQDFLPLTK